VARRRGLDPNALQRIRDDLVRGLDDTRPSAPTDATEFVRPSFIASGHDIGPYFVGKAEEYYQGPQLSTRVAAHSFIPVDDDGVPFVVKNQSPLDNYQPEYGRYVSSNASYAGTPISDNEHGPYGYVFVRWQKKRTLWVYGTTEFIPMSVYRVFRDYYSKGRAVVHMLEQYGHQNADGFMYGGVSGV
jgi:hypothetical protein